MAHSSEIGEKTGKKQVNEIKMLITIEREKEKRLYIWRSAF